MIRCDPASLCARPTVVAIPARNEAGHIDRCLDALAAQQGVCGRPLVEQAPFEVLVLVNNTSDDTAARIGRWRAENRLSVAVRQIDLIGEAHAGAARKAVMDWASEKLGSARGSVICTTDADSEVDPGWLRQTWAALRAGADAVAGAVDFDPSQLADLGLSPLRKLESRFATLQARIGSLLDPEPHNPWPNHIWAWGASLAVTAEAYRQIGGLPPAPLAEDRALVAALKRGDFRVRHALDVRVRTSTRTAGRAPGGLADLVKLYSSGDEMAPCDAELQPVDIIVERATLRSHLRRIRKAFPRFANSIPNFAGRLRVSEVAIEQAVCEPSFGRAWGRLEEISPALARQRLFPRELPHQIFLAENVLRRQEAHDVEHQGDNARAETAGLWSAPAQLAQ